MLRAPLRALSRFRSVEEAALEALRVAPAAQGAASQQLAAATLPGNECRRLSHAAASTWPRAAAAARETHSHASSTKLGTFAAACAVAVAGAFTAQSAYCDEQVRPPTCRRHGGAGCSLVSQCCSVA
jgi:hypothetical protein